MFNRKLIMGKPALLVIFLFKIANMVLESNEFFLFSCLVLVVLRLQGSKINQLSMNHVMAHTVFFRVN